jgi:hypothetical protein
MFSRRRIVCLAFFVLRGPSVINLRQHYNTHFAIEGAYSVVASVLSTRVEVV